MSLMVEDPQNAIVESKTINIINEPPKITSYLLHRVCDLLVVQSTSMRLQMIDGNNDDLMVSSRSHSGRMSVPTGNMTQVVEVFIKFLCLNRQGRDNSVYGTQSYRSIEQSDNVPLQHPCRDPLIFDLNMDGKVELQVEEVPLQIPDYSWTLGYQCFIDIQAKYKILCECQSRHRQLRWC